MLKTLSRFTVVSTAAMSALVACSLNIRDLSPEQIGRRITVKGGTEANIWLGPELTVSHYRALFHGYDTVFYRLAKSISLSQTPEPHYRLLIEAHYGGDLRHYQQITLEGGSHRSASTMDHQAERCQFFNSLIYACLFRDQMAVDLPLAELEARRTKGMRLVLGSVVHDYEQIDLPASYIDGFLRTVTVSTLPR